MCCTTVFLSIKRAESHSIAVNSDIMNIWYIDLKKIIPFPFILIEKEPLKLLPVKVKSFSQSLDVKCNSFTVVS